MVDQLSPNTSEEHRLVTVDRQPELLQRFQRELLLGQVQIKLQVHLDVGQCPQDVVQSAGGHPAVDEAPLPFRQLLVRVLFNIDSQGIPLLEDLLDVGDPVSADRSHEKQLKVGEPLLELIHHQLRLVSGIILAVWEDLLAITISGITMALNPTSVHPDTNHIKRRQREIKKK